MKILAFYTSIILPLETKKASYIASNNAPFKKQIHERSNVSRLERYLRI